MIIAWGVFIASTFLFLVWMTELIPSMSEKRRGAGKQILLWFVLMLLSAQYIFGPKF